MKPSLCVCWLLLLCTACENDLQKIRSFNEKSVGIEFARDVESLYSQSGHLKAKLTAPYLQRYLQDPPTVLLTKGLRVEFYNDSTLEIESVLTAKYGKYFENENNVLLRDSVVVINKKGERLDCQELQWNANKQLFYTDKPVKVTTLDEIIYGDGLEANQDFSHYQILHPRGNINVKSSELPQ